MEGLQHVDPNEAITVDVGQPSLVVCVHSQETDDHSQLHYTEGRWGSGGRHRQAGEYGEEVTPRTQPRFMKAGVFWGLRYVAFDQHCQLSWIDLTAVLHQPPWQKRPEKTHQDDAHQEQVCSP